MTVTWQRAPDNKRRATGVEVGTGGGGGPRANIPNIPNIILSLFTICISYYVMYFIMYIILSAALSCSAANTLAWSLRTLESQFNSGLIKKDLSSPLEGT